jgi:hypothetical protein
MGGRHPRGRPQAELKDLLQPLPPLSDSREDISKTGRARSPNSFEDIKSRDMNFFTLMQRTMPFLM